MVRGAYRSRTFRRIKNRLSASRVVVKYAYRNVSLPSCGSCGSVLPGVKNMRCVESRTSPKTFKRSQRPFGGVLCSKCMRDVFVAKARKL